MNNQVKSAARVLDVLELLSRQPEPMRLNELVARLGFPKSSAYGLLSTLVARGYVKKDSADRYAIVETFRQGFGWVGGLEGFLTSVAAPVVEEMRDLLDETVFVCVRTPEQNARLVTKAVSRQPIRYDASDQSSLPGYGTVMGRVLLAFQPDEVIDDYFARTELRAFNERTPTDEAAIRAALARIRADGFGTIVDEYATGGAGIAAPIRNADGAVVAVIDVATVTARYEQRRDEMLAAVLEGAARISARLGYRPDPDTNQTQTPQGDA
ncbi:IclR family transcriptional regulator [Pseudooceanicola nanhaiensis]|uniref:IclR family transcriptional regulator n=1 Tax=Pseudooceanicola nanhaiensis TaxID=375761 RepID=UPI001CD3522B|nr:IclR family transcriptional regulator [Pseudooceanicola nanhaiensis]MCA0919077.1 IclR family transcriptional regulator [Pseudooceanicola nanhaiensis]